MTAGAPAAMVGSSARRDATERFARAFKGAMAAMRRMRGREHRHSGELSDAQYSLLFCLRESSVLPSSELATAADLSPAAVTEMLDGLAAQGLVERVRSERDRRVVLTSLTDHGRALVEARRTRFDSYYQAAMSRFSDDELRTAAAVLDRLATMFDEIARDHG